MNNAKCVWRGRAVAALLCSVALSGDRAGAQELLDQGNATAAPQGPDLVIIREATRIGFEGCALGQTLVAGRTYLKNIGDATAEIPLGIIERYTRSLSAAYVPQHLDLLDHGRDTAILEPGQSAQVLFAIGKGKVKAGRLIDTRPFAADDIAPIESFGQDAIKLYQEALKDLGHYELEIDGIPGPGFRKAVRAFQGAGGLKETGLLTVGDAQKLAEASGKTLRTGATLEPGEVRFQVYVVADPYNLIAETDETNNRQVWNAVINCGPSR